MGRNLQHVCSAAVNHTPHTCGHECSTRYRQTFAANGSHMGAIVFGCAATMLWIPTLAVGPHGLWLPLLRIHPGVEVKQKP